MLINARNVTKLVATADRDAFCCGVSIEELKKRGHSGALSWIEKFAEQRNGVGKPLPAVLKRTGLEWYELQDKEIAEVFTMMNLKTAELSTEQNCNMIDGVPNNTPIPPTPPELDAKPLDKVKEPKERRKGRELER